MKLILASQSPQRAQILRDLQIDFKVVPSDIEEKFNPQDNPRKIAEDLALQKAQAVAKQYPQDCVLGVDTLVVAQGKIIGKPASRAEARQMILHKSEQMEQVISGLALVCGEQVLLDSEMTEVHFGKITPAIAEQILDFNEWQDRSGAFSIEGRTKLYIRKINGCFWNVVGLPVYVLGEVLQCIKKGIK